MKLASLMLLIVAGSAQAAAPGRRGSAVVAPQVVFAVAEPSLIDGGTPTGTNAWQILDALFDKVDTDAARAGSQWSIEPPAGWQLLASRSVTTNTATADASLIRWVTNGIWTVHGKVSRADGATSGFVLGGTNANVGGANYTNFSVYTNSSLARAIVDDTTALLAAGVVTNLFNGNAWNSNCPAFALTGITGIPRTASWGNLALGIALSRRHILTATHAAPAVGGRYTFISRAGDVWTNSLVLSSAAVLYDAHVVLVDPGLPATIEVPYVFTNHLVDALLPSLIGRTPGFYPELPVLTVQQDREVHVLNGVRFGNSTNKYAAAIAYAYPGLEPWHRAIRSGDSGNVTFLTVNSNVVVVGTWYLHYYSSWIGSMSDLVQTTMNTLSAAAGHTNEPLRILETTDYAQF